ncbi:MAG: type II toxin-antitoxin system HicB family antitoxin [Candidatus Falkowbacteria bacterium]
MKLLINLQYDFEYKGFVADCPSLPGCMSQGKTKKEALKNIKEAIRGYIKVLKKHHQTTTIEITVPSYVELTV